MDITFMAQYDKIYNYIRLAFNYTKLSMLNSESSSTIWRSIFHVLY